ncbi:DsbA family protein [Falsarthrobacter nasiphocae]|uniref:Protein-disulfide isomerase n=1 Tax=Falsarthrobacter nasiphocae TaxID=189863 RepID=A0AAE3YEK6_9MICC|nr:thioredoxin domain-containing protein [Falsarthrobacter nasiphocae]MDR6891750.1 protein-disulfide isomerase [Falsarthrobacter nasiphocae]
MASRQTPSGLTPREIAQQHREKALRKERSRRAVIGGAIIAAVLAIVLIVTYLFKKNNEAAGAADAAKGPAPAYGNQYGGVTLIKGGTLKKAGGIEVDPGTVGPPATAPSTKAPSGALTTKKGEPAHVLVYVDMLCPHCKVFEGMFGDYLHDLAEKGTANVEYRVISILDQAANKNYSTRAGGALMSVADRFPEKFYPALKLLFAQQPSEATGGDNGTIKSVLKSAGVPSEIDSLVDSGAFRYYTKFANALAAHDGVSGTPSVYVEGQRWDPQAESDFKKFVQATIDARK